MTFLLVPFLWRQLNLIIVNFIKRIFYSPAASLHHIIRIHLILNTLNIHISIPTVDQILDDYLFTVQPWMGWKSELQHPHEWEWYDDNDNWTDETF